MTAFCLRFSAINGTTSMWTVLRRARGPMMIYAVGGGLLVTSSSLMWPAVVVGLMLAASEMP